MQSGSIEIASAEASVRTPKPRVAYESRVLQPKVYCLLDNTEPRRVDLRTDGVWLLGRSPRVQTGKPTHVDRTAKPRVSGRCWRPMC